ncbi:MAG: Omp28-related outer membrane protein [Flavobacteriales bacterium]
MRRFSLLSTLLPFALSAQTLVGTSPANRTVLMEEFTAVNCGYCPAGHVIAADLENTHGTDLVVVGINAGGLAMPGGGQPDLRTAEGTALWNFYFLNSQPKAVVGRTTYNGFTTLTPANWGVAVDSVLQQTSPVNLGFASAFNQGTRLLTVDVELYYTANSPGGNDHITVLLKEDHITAYQNDYGPNGPQASYDHKNVLRAFLTPLWGDEVTTTTQSTLVTRTYSYTVPLDFNISNCSTVAFVGEYQSTVYQALETASDGGSTLGLADPTATAFGTPYPVPANDVVHIPLGNDFTGGTIAVLDLLGKVVALQGIAAGTTVAHIGTGALAEGTYLVRRTDAPGAESRLLLVQH